jgi:hypothetical protein
MTAQTGERDARGRFGKANRASARRHGAEGTPWTREEKSLRARLITGLVERTRVSRRSAVLRAGRAILALRMIAAGEHLTGRDLTAAWASLESAHRIAESAIFDAGLAERVRPSRPRAAPVAPTPTVQEDAGDDLDALAEFRAQPGEEGDDDEEHEDAETVPATPMIPAPPPGPSAEEIARAETERAEAAAISSIAELARRRSRLGWAAHALAKLFSGPTPHVEALREARRQGLRDDGPLGFGLLEEAAANAVAAAEREGRLL